MSSVLVEREGGVGVIRLNRAERRNALDAEMIRGIAEALVELDADDSVAALLLEAEDPVFCAGLDLKELQSGGSLDVVAMTPEGDPWAPTAKPLIGAINGAAVTGGLELALHCDVLIASEKARFADTHSRVGLAPFWGLTWRLPAAIGPRAATYMSLTNEFIGADVALRLGLVAEVVPHELLRARSRTLADAVAQGHQGVLSILRGAYARGGRSTPDPVLAEIEDAMELQGRLDAGDLDQRSANLLSR